MKSVELQNFKEQNPVVSKQYRSIQFRKGRSLEVAWERNPRKQMALLPYQMITEIGLAYAA